jgi:hypothetical protein
VYLREGFAAGGQGRVVRTKRAFGVVVGIMQEVAHLDLNGQKEASCPF